MLMILYASLKKTKSLVCGDMFYLMADDATANIVRGVPGLSEIIVIPMPTPATLLEGMSWRYQFHRHTDVMFQNVCYLDVDMICLKQFKLQISDRDILCVYPEGSSSDNNYSGAQKPLKGLVGYSSTLFAYNLGEHVLQLFEGILYKMRVEPENHYTLDQPYFNHALQAFSRFVQLPDTLLSFNGHNNMPGAYFINYAGSPGDGAFHFLKGLQLMCCC